MLRVPLVELGFQTESFKCGRERGVVDMVWT